MKSVKTIPDLVIRKMKSADLEKTKHMLSEAFLTEPLAARAKVAYQDILTLFDLFSEQMLKDELTLVAHPKHGDLIGASMATDYTTAPGEEFTKFVGGHPHFSKVFSLYGHCSQLYYQHHDQDYESFPRGHSVHMHTIGVLPEYRHVGVALDLKTEAIKLYIEKGYQFALSDATSDFARRINEVSGFETMFSVPYATWFGAESVYAKEVKDSHTGLHFMVKDLKKG